MKSFSGRFLARPVVRARVLGGAAFAVVASLAIASAAPAATPDPAGVEFFEKKVRPLLVEQCYSCHSAQAKRLRANLYLDSEQGWLKGGDLGPAVTPGDPKASLLITAIRHEDDLKMPPKGKLSDDQVAVLTRWIAMGAPAPLATTATPAAAKRSIDLAKGREFWAFKPPTEPPLPAVKNAAWPRNGLDRLILAALEAKGLTPAPEADKRTLIRRATFDLTGLPPTPDEIQAFLADNSPEAFAKVVDRLLDSPHYGERWGRHWLDVARYADSNGLDENVAHGNAWRYRDYVIAAFNNDKPYDQFVLEQLAGDLLPTESPAARNERLIATGFLSLGPKVLAEPDEKKMEMDLVDEQVDTVGRAFLGLTLGCARCHDHKFDPIGTADYYGLAGIFKSTRTMETFTKVAKWYENPLASDADLARKAAFDQEVAAKKKAIQSLIDDANKRLKADKGDAFTLPKDPEPLYPKETQAALKRQRDELAAFEKNAPEMPSAMGVTEGQIADTQIHVRGSHTSLGAAIPRRVPLVLTAAQAPAFSMAQSGRLELARWLVEGNHPLTSRVMVNRLWRWHFGRGLVGSTDNFGALGERPSNPLLLDWLARQFVEGGWSIKSTHRLIMLSSTYRMSSDDNPAAARVDPENRLLGRMNRRRLEAEAIRDALLAVGGPLDPTMGGSLLQVKNRAYFFDHTSRDTTGYDTGRRSVYLPVVRNHLYDMFDLFDSTDASVTNGDRATTTVAPQALFMLNGDLVLRSARALAAGLLDRPGLDDAGRVALLYERAYGRPPSDEESKRAATYLERLGRVLAGEGKGPITRLDVWQALCQVVLASNEFLTIR
ncbi:MAG: PSD1 and planctomycete cytochrome C domain-containing protein [Isosphaeraceae bacterium]|nr:PSD1 and planctomycete cytochrome C domain-containing protein [Isosphaeraceae bacterium]